MEERKMSPSFDKTRKDKPYKARVTHNGINHSYGYYKSKEECNQVEVDKKRELIRMEERKNRGGVKSISTYSILDLVTKKLEESEEHFVPTTTKNIRNMGKKWLEHFGESRILESITSDDVKLFLYTKGKGKKKSNQTSNSHRKFGKSLWKFGIRENMIEEDIFSNIKRLREKKRKKLILPSVQEMKDVVEWCNSNGEEYMGDFLKILCQTGCRNREITLLKWSDVDFHKETIEVWSRKSSKEKYEERPIGVGKDVMEILVSRKERQKKEGIKSVFVFEWNTDGISEKDPQWYSRPYNQKYKNLQKIFRKSGMSRTIFHKLRHQFSIRMSEEGIPTYKLSKILGHKNQSTTDIYLKGKINGEEIEHLTGGLGW